MICHRSADTAFRGKVCTSITLEHFQAWLQETDDDGRSAKVIAVSSRITSTDSVQRTQSDALYCQRITKLILQSENFSTKPTFRYFLARWVPLQDLTVRA